MDNRELSLPSPGQVLPGPPVPPSGRTSADPFGQLRREGIKASAPMFIPFMGALITAKSLGENALAEARVGLAGPVLGSLGAAACLAIGEATNSDLFRALAYVGFFLNLFNLLPVVPLDGGRAMAAMAPWVWFVGLGVLVAMLFVFPNFIL